MSDIKLFRIAGRRAREIQGSASFLEKPLQHLIEANLEPLLGIRFLVTEYSTGKTHAGRIDTLGLDENNSPVIIEYKRTSHENIINQGLFYFDWLMDHQAEFKLLVLETFGKSAADDVDWTAPRLICIAADFTRYDSHAVQQMDRNIELIRYRQFGQELLLLELVNAGSAMPASPAKKKSANAGHKTKKGIAEALAKSSPSVQALFEAVEGYVTSLGDDVRRKDLKLYVAFTRLRNFATVCFLKNQLQIYLHLDPDTVDLVSGFTRDKRGSGHWGTGDLEVTITSIDDLNRAKPLLLRAYEGSRRAT